ncbi:MAG: methylphosphotriester-DNA--protein-cysteine methyltransferase family protein [Gorillibacterium sp.]|nr:methylphosphotriester-DNA--protein-cysteine methyltransferase family protein [Gorillibacterium sp.]
MDEALFERIYQSVVSRESTYDGVYYTGVRTTHIVCRPSCRARTPKSGNVTFYSSLEKAIAAGFRPCKRCKPEAGGRFGPNAMIAAQVNAIIETQYQQKLTLQSLAELLRISPFHLQRTYKQLEGYSPSVKLERVRLTKAQVMLSQSPEDIVEIGRAVGFRSPSHFAAWFSRKMGMSPSEFRNSRRMDP